MGFKTKEIINRGTPFLKWASKVLQQDKNSIGTLSPPIKEIWSFLAPVLWCMGLIKIQSALNHKRKKYFRFWLHYYYGAWNFENNSFRLDSHWKKIYISVSGYSTIMVHGLLWYIAIWIQPSPEKKILILWNNTIMVHGTYKSFS